jgi:Ca2+-binding RTX toxin-like protein
VTGGFDADRLSGGPGNDELNAVGGGADTIDCGAGFDRVFKDSADTAVNCESVG